MASNGKHLCCFVLLDPTLRGRVPLTLHLNYVADYAGSPLSHKTVPTNAYYYYAVRNRFQSPIGLIGEIDEKRNVSLCCFAMICRCASSRRPRESKSFSILVHPPPPPRGGSHAPADAGPMTGTGCTTPWTPVWTRIGYPAEPKAFY